MNCLFDLPDKATADTVRASYSFECSRLTTRRHRTAGRTHLPPLLSLQLVAVCITSVRYSGIPNKLKNGAAGAVAGARMGS